MLVSTCPDFVTAAADGEPVEHPLPRRGLGERRGGLDAPQGDTEARAASGGGERGYAVCATARQRPPDAEEEGVVESPSSEAS